MIPDDLRTFLQDRGVQFEERHIQEGTQFRCQGGGEVFSLYNSGKLVIQGKRTSLSDEIQNISGNSTPAQPRAASQAASDTAASSPATTVFIVYGHDSTARDSLELLLRRFGLNPIILQQLPASGDTIIEKLEQYVGRQGGAGYACVLLTPDDEGHTVGMSEEKKYRARQNVILELGMVLARLGRRKVAILYKESVELPSDIAGLIYIPFKERVDEVRSKLFQELKAAGYDVNPVGLN